MAGLVEVRRRRVVLLVPGERPLTPIHKEGFPSREIVGMPSGIPPLLRRELEVVVVRDGHPTRVASRKTTTRKSRCFCALHHHDRMLMSSCHIEFEHRHHLAFACMKLVAEKPSFVF